jgi:threonine synthase
MAEQMRGFDETRAMQLTNSQRENAARLFTSVSADPKATTAALQWAHRHAGQVIDPHTAVGLHASLVCADEGTTPRGTPIVTLATAHPAKFRDAVERAIGIRPQLPSRVGDLFGREEQFTSISGEYAAARQFVLDNAAGHQAAGATA